MGLASETEFSLIAWEFWYGDEDSFYLSFEREIKIR